MAQFPATDDLREIEKAGSEWASVHNGKRYKKSWGRVKKSRARELEEEFRTDVRNGRHKRKMDNPRFDKAMDEYLKGVEAACAPGTYMTYLYKAKRLKDFFGAKRVDQIENNEILMRKYMEKRKAEIKEEQMERGRTEEEEERLFGAIENIDKRGGHLKDILIIGLHTGMRKGEILSLHRDWVDFKEGFITVPRIQQKRKRKDKRVPINSETRPLLKRLVADAGENGFLFENRSTGRPIKDIKTSWQRALKLAGLHGKPGVDRLRVHDLRHTAGTRLMRNTGDMKLVAKYLGHTDIRTTARYLHPDDRDLTKAAESLVRVPPLFTPVDSEEKESKRPTLQVANKSA